MFRTRSYAFVLFSIGAGFAQTPASISLTPSAVSVSAGNPVTFQAEASQTTKRVTFFDRATILGTAAVNGEGRASFSAAWLAAGKHQIYAVAPGGARSQATEITVERVASSSFETAEHYAAGLAPNAMAIADFNGDGHLDIALAGASGISVLPGHGDGTFGDPLLSAAAFQPTAMAAADFDGDGLMDLAVTDGTTGKIYFLRGAGDGTFRAPRVIATAANPVALAVGDFNGDGIADLAVADQAGNTVLLLLGAGDGSFRAPVRIEAGVGPAALAVGDFNSDGMADLAVANFGSNDVTILLGKGDGTFSSGAPLKVGNGPAAMLMSDLNGDGMEDLAVLNRVDATATVFYGKGDGTFQSGISLPAGSAPIGIAASDPDKNGFRALLVADGSQFRWQQLTASGAQTEVQLDAGAGAKGIAVGDFTGDGRSGVAIADQDGAVLRPRMAGDAFRLLFSECVSTALAGQSFSCSVEAINILDDPAFCFTDTVGFTSSDGAATLPTNSTIIPNPKSFNFTLETPGPQTITATDLDNTLGGGSTPASITVDAAATHFSVSTITSTRAGTQFSVTVTALDLNGNTVTSYAGTVQITSSDTRAQLPPNSTLTNGVGIFLVTFESVGSQTVTARDVSTLITGTSGAIAVSAGYPGYARIVSGTNQSAVVGTAFPTVLEITVLDFFNNPVPGLPVRCQVPSTGASALMSSPIVVTNAFGMASVTATANVVPGNYFVMLGVEVFGVAGPMLLPRGGAPTATFSLTNLPNVTVQTSPPGLAFSVDGISYTTPQSFGFALNSNHTIAVASPQAGASGSQYAFSNWSNNGPASHSITATGTPATYTATFGTQYQLTTSASPTAGGTVTPASGNFYNSGASVSLTATPNSGYRFNHWNGLNQQLIVTTTPIIMSGPESVTAVFVMNPQVSPAALNLQYNQGAVPSTVTGSLSVSTGDHSSFSVTAADGWLTVPASSTTTPATVTVTANVAGMQPGVYNSILTLIFSDGSLSVIPVTLTVLGTPQLVWVAVPAGPLNFTVQSGSTTVPSPEIIISAASQNVPLQVTAAVSSPPAGQWLSLSPDGNSSGTTPQGFHVRVDPSGLAAGVYQGTITATSSTAGVSPLNIPVTLTLTPAPLAISVSLIQNAASFKMGSEAPNTILSAFGVYPGCTSGAEVSVDGSPTTVFYSSPTQLNFLFPASVSGETSASLQIQCGGLKSAVIQVPVLNLAPAIFTVGQNGTGQAAIVNPDGSVATTATPGSDIQVFGTGFGLLGPVGSDGLRHVLLPVTATIGGMPATVLFAGEAPGTTTGLQQINVQIPAKAPQGPAIPLQLTVGGVSTAAGVTLAIQ
jgi:uncharacterized protein (TIGR03437 family)